MSMKRSNGGFTLVEFVVTIAIASMITLAATSMLLLGLRIHHQSNSTAGTLNTVSMLYSVMDTIASENEITDYPYSADFDSITNDPWKLKTDSTVIEYRIDDGDEVYNTIYLNGTAFISNVKTSKANLDKTTGLLTIIITTNEDKDYSFSIYCRKGGT